MSRNEVLVIFHNVLKYRDKTIAESSNMIFLIKILKIF
jgi:hypothetical protein